MTDDFRKRMEKSGKRTMAAIEQQSAMGWRFAERTRQTTKIREAIEGIEELSGMICDDGSCKSVFCMTCRKNKQASLYRQYRNRVKRFTDDDEAREHLRYTTILHELVPVSFNGIIAEESSLHDIELSVARFREGLKSIDRHFHKHDLWARGTIHLELVNMELFRFSSLSGRITTKQRTLKDLETDLGVSADYYVLVHSHILFDTNGLDDKKFGGFIRKRWDVNIKQVDVSRLTKFYIDDDRFTEHTVEDAIKNISRYGYNGSNAKLTYSTNWGGSRKVYTKQQRTDAMGQINNYVEGVKGLDLLDEKLTKGEIRFLIKAHNRFTDDGRGLLVSIL
jgi:hypothetical protein